MPGGIKMAMHIVGARRIERALFTASIEARQRVAFAIKVTAEEVQHGAQMRVPIRTGELKSTIRAEPGNSPFHWFVKAGYGTLKRRSRRTRTTKRRPKARVAGPTESGIYAMVVEFGSQGGRAAQPAQPYMFPALEASRSRHIDRLHAALDGAMNATERVA